MPIYIKPGYWLEVDKPFGKGWLNIETLTTQNPQEAGLLYPVENTYVDNAEMLANQNEQTHNYFQYVVSTDTYYEKLSTSTAQLTDYRELTADEVTIIQGPDRRPVHRDYADAATMYSAQNQRRQIRGYIYRLNDDNSHYEYLGTRNGDATDYIQIGSGGVLEAIDEGNGTGYVVSGRTAANYGNVGAGAWDFTSSNTASSVFGATGDNSVAFGFETTAAGPGDYVFGSNNTTPATNGGNNYIFGGGNTILGTFFSYLNVVGGTAHTVDDYANAVFGYGHNVSGAANGAAYNITSGRANEFTGYGCSAFGFGLRGTGSYCSLLGMSNVDFTENDTGNSTVQRRLVVVGNGTIDGNATRLVPSDAFRVWADGQVEMPSITNALIDGWANGKIVVSREWVENEISTAPAPSLQAVTDVGNTTTNNIDAASFNSLELFAQTGVDADNISIGTNALLANTGGNSIGIGTDALRNNTGQDETAVGYWAMRDNTGNANTAVGYFAMRNGTGGNCNGVGSSVLLNNTGDFCNAVGNNAGENNTQNFLAAFGHVSAQHNLGLSVTSVGGSSTALVNTGDNISAFGSTALQQNTGDNSVGIGGVSGTYIQGNNNTAVGHSAWSDFKDDTGNAQNVADATTDVDTAQERITITAHGFGSTGTYVNLRYSTTGTPIGGLGDGNVYQVEIIDANTFQFRPPTNITTNGTDTHTFTPQFAYTNSTALGYNAEPTASNQVMLGDSNVTQVLSSGNFEAQDSSTVYSQLKANGSIITQGGTDLRMALLPATGQIWVYNGNANLYTLQFPSSPSTAYTIDFPEDSGTVGLNSIKQVKVSLTATNVNNIGTTPITAIAAPGAGFVINVISAFANLTYGTTAFDNNTLDLETSGAGGTLFTWSSFLDSTADNLKTADRTASSDDDLIVNTAVVLAGTDSVATGDSTVDVYITYEIIEL